MPQGRSKDSSTCAESGPDFGFLQRTYRTSALLGAIGALTLSATAQWKFPAGWIVGVALGLTTLKSKECLARAFMASIHKQSRGVFIGFTLANYAITGLTLWLIVRYQLVNLLWMLAGFTLVLTVIVLKAIGWHCFVCAGAPNWKSPEARVRG